MIVETVGLGSVAIAAIGLSALLIKKQAERDKRMAESLDKNTTILDELKTVLYRLNGKLK